jgi:hypothetical protein
MQSKKWKKFDARLDTSLQITSGLTCMASSVHIMSTQYKELLQLHPYKTTVVQQERL